MCRDITDKILSEDSSEMLTTVLNESNYVYILYSSLSGKIDYSNSIEILTGVPASDFMSGKYKFKDFIHPEDNDKFYSIEQLIKLQELNVPPICSLKLIDKSGTTKRIEVKYIVKIIGNKKHLGLIIKEQFD